MANDKKLIEELSQIERNIDDLRLKQNRAIVREIREIQEKYSASFDVPISVEFDPMSEEKCIDLQPVKRVVMGNEKLFMKMLNEIEDLLDDHGHYLAAANTGRATLKKGDIEFNFIS